MDWDEYGCEKYSTVREKEEKKTFNLAPGAASQPDEPSRS